MFSRKKFRYEYDDNGDADHENGIYSSLPPPAPITVSDRLIALCLGVGVAIVSWLLSYHGLHPSVWTDCAVAAGIRAPAEICPGVWRGFARLLFLMTGPDLGCHIIAIGGKVALGFLAATAYMTFRSMLCIIVRKLPENGFWNRCLACASSAVAALAFVFSDPVWTTFQAFGSQAARTLMLVITIGVWIRFLHCGRLRHAYGSMFASGLFLSESPLGFMVLVGFWFIYSLLYSRGFLAQVELVNVLVKQDSKWSLTACGAFGLILGITANVVGYIMTGGLAANGLDAGSVSVVYAIQYWGLMSGSASLGGWIVGAGIVIMPFVLALALVCRATDVEFFLRYQVGIMFFAVGCVAYSQLASLYPLWFWTWMKAQPMVGSPLLLCFFVYMAAVTVLCALSVLGVDFCCRNNRRLAWQFDPDNIASSAKVGNKGPRKTAYIVFSTMGVILLGVLPGRIQPKTMEMLSIMRDYVLETVKEAGDAKWLFTDGSYDCAIELESLVQGGHIKCVPLKKSIPSRDSYACMKTLPDEEDRLSMSSGGPNLLSTWERDKPARIEESAVQLCFELWRRSGKAYPPVAGVLARAAGKMSPDEIDASIARAFKLAERILSVQARGVSRLAGRDVGELFLYMQWRLARLARVRAEIFDRVGDHARAIAEGELSRSLDDANVSLRQIVDAMTRLRELTMRQMTPREGLQFALVRADFALARRYAAPILDADPDDPSANFGMGMSYYDQEQYGRAEEYLSRCLKRNSGEPTIWNNLAVVQLKTGKLEEALENAKRALSIIPQSSAVQDTVAAIEAAIKERDEAAASGGAPAAADGKAQESAK